MAWIPHESLKPVWHLDKCCQPSQDSVSPSVKGDPVNGFLRSKRDTVGRACGRVLGMVHSVSVNGEPACQVWSGDERKAGKGFAVRWYACTWNGSQPALDGAVNLDGEPLVSEDTFQGEHVLGLRCGCHHGHLLKCWAELRKVTGFPNDVGERHPRSQLALDWQRGKNE